jgi:NTP pyrophosphatase (non-canonical NTP hydrolase)
LQHASLRSGRIELNLADEIGDLLFTLAAFANVNRMHLGECKNRELEKYQTRESIEW